MTYKGHVQDGLVVLDEPVSLQDGVAVRIEVLALHPDIVRFTGILPADLDACAEYVEGMARKHA